jgi:hypothetical protein
MPKDSLESLFKFFLQNFHRNYKAAVYLCMPRKWEDMVQKLTNALNAGL